MIYLAKAIEGDSEPGPSFFMPACERHLQNPERPGRSRRQAGYGKTGSICSLFGSTE